MTLKKKNHTPESAFYLFMEKNQENSDNIHVQGEALNFTALSLGHQHSQEARNVDRKPALDSSSRACSFKSELGLDAQDPFQHKRRSFLKKHTQFSSPMRF